MEKQEDFEAAIFRYKLAHKSWYDYAVARGITPPKQASDLVWELLVRYAEARDHLGPARYDIHKIAYELGALLLPTLAMKRIFGVYRDALFENIVSVSLPCNEQVVRSMLGFANLVSGAFSDAQADMLRKECLHNRVEGLSRELKLAKRIQMHLLPKDIPAIAGFDFAGRLIPAEEIGGDYWSVDYKPKDDVVTLKLADISGHGVAAATLVAAVKFITAGYYQSSSSAAEVIENTNRVLVSETPHDVLVTMTYAWLRPATHELYVVNAGHAPVFLCQEKRCVDIPLTGPALGVTEDAEYGELRFELNKGDVLFFGSDGITEAGTIHDFGLERLKKVVQECSGLSADGIADSVVQAVTQHVSNPHDDISMVVVKVTSEKPTGA